MIELTIFVLSGLAVRRATGESANLVTSSSNSSMETNSSSTFFLTSQSDYVSNSSVNHLNWQNVLILCLFSPIVIVSLCGKNEQRRKRTMFVTAKINCRFSAQQTLIFFLRCLGNLLVCRTLLVQRRLRANSTNVLIGVLAISDLLMTGMYFLHTKLCFYTIKIRIFIAMFDSCLQY